MGMQDTKVFFQQEGKLQLVKQLKGGVFHLTKNKTNTELSTLWQPCCGSYTSRLLTYRFSESESGELQSAIFFIGRLTPILVDEIELKKNKPKSSTRLIDYRKLKKGHVDTLRLFALHPDFRGISPYFKDQTKKIRGLLRAKRPVPLLTYPMPTPLYILSTKTYGDETWHLVLTDVLDNVPKSLYEWGDGDRRQFVGWIKAADLR